MPHPSTFSIVAHDPAEKAWGIAVASKFLAVGAVVPWARAGAGAVATQSFANTSFGPLGLDGMESGLSAAQTLNRLLAADPQAGERQVGLVDASGGSATHTGAGCSDWAGGLTGAGYAIQGNVLAGPQVIEAMHAAYTQDPGQSLIRRLYAALLAGDRAGGDRRGRQSAAILVVKPGGGYGGFNDRWADLRVDDHPDPLSQLGALLDLFDLYFGKSPTSDQITLAGQPLARLQNLMARLGYYQGDPDTTGIYDAPTRSALETFIGNENFEERTDFTAGRIDRPVFDYLFAHFGG